MVSFRYLPIAQVAETDPKHIHQSQLQTILKDLFALFTGESSVAVPANKEDEGESISKVRLVRLTLWTDRLLLHVHFCLENASIDRSQSMRRIGILSQCQIRSSNQSCSTSGVVYSYIETILQHLRTQS